jgi:hypothetical protein
MSGRPPIIFLSAQYFDSISMPTADGFGVTIGASDWMALRDKGAQMVDLMRIMHGVRNENMVATATITQQGAEISRLKALVATQAAELEDRRVYTEKTTTFILRLMQEVPDAMARLEKEAIGK